MVAGRGPDCISHLWQNRRHSGDMIGFGYSPSATNEVGISAKTSEIQPASVCLSKQPCHCRNTTAAAISAKANRGEKEQHILKTARGRGVFHKSGGRRCDEMESDAGMCLPNTLQSLYGNLKA